MFYVYQEGYYGTELIGKSPTYEGAAKIKADRDAKWEVGFLWHTYISDKQEKEYSFFD
jgi:hypothetical protein